MVFDETYRLLPNIDAVPDNSPFEVTRILSDGKVLVKVYKPEHSNLSGITTQEARDIVIADEILVGE